MQFDKELDARGLNCPLPILRTKKALTDMTTGQVLKIIATDPGAVKDFQYLTAADFTQGFLGTQDGQRTVQTTCIKFFIKIHGVLLTLNRHVLKNAAVP